MTATVADSLAHMRNKTYTTATVTYLLLLQDTAVMDLITHQAYHLSITYLS